MQEFSLIPNICMIETCRDFLEQFQVGQKDVIITTKFLYETYFKDFELESRFMFQDQYGVGEPTEEMIASMYESMKEMNYSRIIAVGGGSVIDISKIFVLKNIFPLVDLFDKKIPATKEKELIIVPTTCGTGSEVTNISIVNLTSVGSKKGLAIPELFPEYAVLIPEFVEKLPLSVFATSSIDALVHAVESFLSPKATVYSELFSREAIQKILTAYRNIKEEGLESRGKYIKDILIASNMAGIAFGNAGCAAVQAMSYPLGGKYHVPHGESNYVMFTEVLKYYYRKNSKGKIVILNEMIAKLLSCSTENVYAALEELLNTLLPKKRLSDYGVQKQELEEFTNIVMTQQQRLMANNYVFLDEKDIYSIYRSLY